MMKAKKSIMCLIAVLLLMAVVCTGLPAMVQADDSLITLHVENTYAEYVTKEQMIKRINEIRLEACEEGIEGWTMDDYVPIKWSSELEGIAQIRAAEASYSFSHTRPNGKSCFTVSYNGVESFGEIIASPGNALSAIELWYGEKYNLVNNTGGEVGHYLALAAPYVRYIGIASFGVTVGEYSDSPGSSEAQLATAGVTKASIEVQKSDFANRFTSYYNEDGVLSLLRGIPDTLEIYIGGMKITDPMKFTPADTSIIQVQSNGKLKGLKVGKTKLNIEVLGVKTTVSVEVKEPQWINTGYGWRYGGDGVYIISEFVKIGGKWYYFDEQGLMVTGWREVDGKWYYMDSDGIMQTSWKKIKNKWYYFGTDGIMVTGTRTIDGKKYTFDKNGVWDEASSSSETPATVKTGWNKVSGKWYYYDSAGKAKTGWLKDGTKWYYMDSKGVMQTGWVKVGGKWYYLNSKGVMQTGWVKDGTKWYYMGTSGAMTTGWQKVSGKWYYMNGAGVMQTGWLKDGSKWYYLGTSGTMTTGWQKVSGKWYYMNGAGVMQTGWLKLSGKWYYLNASGAMVTGTQTIGGKSYTFDKNGVWVN